MKVGDMFYGNRRLTNNDYFAHKLVVRSRALAELGDKREARILDAFAGEGKLWRAMRDRHPDWTFSILGIDKAWTNVSASVLRSDNMKVMAALDLTEFDIIDLDAYGWPAAQLRMVAERAPGVPVVTTCVQQKLSQIPKIVLSDLGLHFPNAAPTLLTRLSGELWEAWLHMLGYRRAIGFVYDHGKTTGAGARHQAVKRYELLLS